MGTVFSFDVRGGDPRAVRAALEEAVDGLHRADAVFSTYREDSQLSRLARGELTAGECDPEVGEVLELAAEAERASDGWFSTTYEGRLDPTGIVKGWAVERAARTLAAAGATGVSVNGGGDVQLLGVPGAGPSGPAASRRSSPRPAPPNWPSPPPAPPNAAPTSSTPARAGRPSPTCSP
jgi:thiamine biosynthesis lipoprotein